MILKRLNSALKTLINAKYIFQDPKKNKLLIFDDTSLDDLEHVLKGMSYFVLETRIERIRKIYLNFKVILLVIKNFRGNLLSAYLMSLIEIVNPKIIFTFIDNSYKFSYFARNKHKNYHFVALQNGARYEQNTLKYLKEKKIYTMKYYKFFIPTYLCFGQNEINDYKKNKIQVNKFIKVGSLRVSNFEHQAKKKKLVIKKPIYDICLISDVFAWDDIANIKNIRVIEGIVKLWKFLIKYSIENKKKFILATRQRKKTFKIEKDFFKKYLTKKEFNFICKRLYYRKEKFKTYKLLCQSKVLVGTLSTTLRENLYLKNKVLACNFSNTRLHDFPLKGICTLKDCNYNTFEKRMSKVLSISKKNYFSKIKNRFYAIENNKISTIDNVRNQLESFLK